MHELTLAAVALSVIAASGPPRGDAAIELVESWPVETELDNPDLRDAHGVWLEMITGARESLDFAEFYASNEEGGRLEEIILAVEAAAKRGVDVRFLAEEKFAKTYPATLARLNAHDGVEVRRYDVASLMGGVLHAKYFLVDGNEAYIGSQNFDWRALEHIQELGARFSAPASVAALRAVFELDWSLAGGTPRDELLPRRAEGRLPFPERGKYGDAAVEITPVFSPREWLPDERLWDLPRIVEAIDAAERTVRVQVLTYKAVSRGEYFEVLESALRRAAARGVEVQLLVADWGKRRGTIEGLQALTVHPGIEVRMATIPAWSKGHVPFGRVVHSKYMVADGRVAWLGTSNWEKGYFHKSRNVGVMIRGEALGSRLDAYFLKGWTSPYAATVDPAAEYEAPRFGD